MIRVLDLIPNMIMGSQFSLRLRAIKQFVDIVDVLDITAPPTIWYKIANRLFQYGLPIPLPDTGRANYKLKKQVLQNSYDIIWVEKGLTISDSTIKYIKNIQPNIIIVNMTPDNMMERPWQSLQYMRCLPLYDYHITTKPFIVEDFYRRGAKKVILVNKTFQRDFHYPRTITDEERTLLGADVGFIGTWEKERCDSLIYLAEHGVKVKVFGEWEWKKYKGKYKNLTIVPHALFDDNYAKALSAFKISLCFLKKRAYDKTTARSIEIPACGGFMLAERTKEHLDLFEENKEAVYFSSNEELLEKCNYYLLHEEERKAIAAAGRKRCVNSDYSNDKMIRYVIDIILKEKSDL